MSKKKTRPQSKFFPRPDNPVFSDILTVREPKGRPMEIGEKIIKAAWSPGVRSIMLLGGTDAGKTTAASTLAAMLSRDCATGILDLDMGQATVGPPSTIAWGLVNGGFSDGFRGLDEVRAEAIYFTGALSPPGNMLPGLTGARLLMDAALLRCEKLIIDTTGFIVGPAARAYKQYKIDLLKPDLIVAAENDSELEHIISPYSRMTSPVIIRTRPSPSARKRSATERADFRAKRLRAFFEGSRVFEVDLNSCALRQTGSYREGPLEGRLVSFRDGFGKDLCLGVIEKADIDKGLLLVSSPLEELTQYACVVIGSAKMLFDPPEPSPGPEV